MSTWKPFVLSPSLTLSFFPSLYVVNYVNKNKLEGLAQHQSMKKRWIRRGEKRGKHFIKSHQTLLRYLENNIRSSESLWLFPSPPSLCELKFWFHLFAVRLTFPLPRFSVLCVWCFMFVIQFSWGTHEYVAT